MQTTREGRQRARELIEKGDVALQSEWLLKLIDDCDRADRLLNSPQIDNFLEAVRTEAAHQVERWGEDDRAKKSDADWLWLVNYLAAKAMFGKESGVPRSEEHTSEL